MSGRFKKINKDALICILIFSFSAIYFSVEIYLNQSLKIGSLIYLSPESAKFWYLLFVLFSVATVILALCREYKITSMQKPTEALPPSIVQILADFEKAKKEAAKASEALDIENKDKNGLNPNYYYKDYLYQDVCPEAQKVQEQYNLSRVQTQMYNHLCRGEYSFEGGEAARIFHPANVICTEWVKKQLDPLIAAGLIKMETVHYGGIKRYDAVTFFDSRYPVKVLTPLTSSKSARNYLYAKQQLHLPEGWFVAGEYHSENFKAEMTEDGYIQMRIDEYEIIEEDLDFAIDHLTDYLRSPNKKDYKPASPYIRYRDYL